MTARYVVAANLLRGKQLIAAAVIYPSSTAEPLFTYTIKGRQWTAHLYQRGDQVPASLDSALSDHIRRTAESWAWVTAHPECPAEPAIALAITRAVERWVCALEEPPDLSALSVLFPTKKQLPDLPASLHQQPATKDWHTAAARALCRHRAGQVI